VRERVRERERMRKREREGGREEERVRIVRSEISGTHLPLAYFVKNICIQKIKCGKKI
jgi:hypothetical protein